MGRTLYLTSPHFTGDDVRDKQRILAGANVFGQNYDPGPIDGDCGEQTARAFKRAHFCVGDAKPQPIFGDRIHGFLTGQKPLPTTTSSGARNG